MTKWEDEILNINRMTSEGMTMKQIGAFYGVTGQRIYQVCSKYGVQTSVRKHKGFMHGRTPEEYWLMKMLYTKTQDKELRRVLFEELTPVPYECPVLGMPLDFSTKGEGFTRNEYSPSIDRIDPSRGYEPGNCAIISWRANRVKNDGTATEHKLIYEWMDNCS